MKFYITTSAPATYYWYYEVEADTQEEAEQLVLDGKAEVIDSEFEVWADNEKIEEVEVAK